MHTLFIQESVCVCILLSGITTVISSLPMIPNNKTILSRVGDQTTLPCTFTPKTSDGLIVTWTKIPEQTVYFFAQGKEDAGKQEERYKDRTFVDESRFNEGNFTLFLEDTRVSDEGNYQCFVRFKPADFESSSLELYVAANYTKPVASCLQSNSTGSAQEASAVTLSCQTEGGYPKAQLVWTFSNGTRVHSAAQRSANDSEGLVSIQSRLVIARALSENLTCGIHNSRLSQSFFTSVTCSLPSSVFTLILRGLRFNLAMWRGVLLICLLLHTAQAEESSNGPIYLVTVPSQIFGGTTETFCAQLLHPNESLTFTVTMETNADNLTLLEERVKENEFYRCVPFQVPVFPEETIVYLRAEVKGKTVDLEKRQKYKTVELQDPATNRIAQWLDRTSVSGILDLSQPLSSEAPQGTYTLHAETDSGNHISQFFNIKEYVLPKYEVKVHLPKSITILDTEVTVKICAKYTYGKPVLGKVTGKFCRPKWNMYWYRRPDNVENNDICHLFNVLGGVGDEVSLTAYITAALLEVETPLTVNGSLHWSRSKRDSRRSDSLEVEMTAYVLMSVLSAPQPSASDLSYASRIVKWLAYQQNPYGGFSSTQDTVVALQALARYSALVYSSEGSSTLTVRSKGGFMRQFHLDQSNRLLYQEEPLQEVPGEYSVEAEGKNCVFVQLALRYNIPPPPGFSTFNISAEARGLCNATDKKTLTVLFTVGYNGKREVTNMVIVNVKLLSGFSPDKLSLENLQRAPLVKRVDTEDGHVIIYIDGLIRLLPMNYAFNIIEDFNVRNLKPAVVKIYDYYQTSKGELRVA
ncbi:UNVERIFIED_CONTAM: hypothetical protein FKN15_012916 [Acipenser sinensis]